MSMVGSSVMVGRAPGQSPPFLPEPGELTGLTDRVITVGGVDIVGQLGSLPSRTPAEYIERVRELGAIRRLVYPRNLPQEVRIAIRLTFPGLVLVERSGVSG